jgi:hypothetical protein
MYPQQNYPLGANCKLPGALVPVFAGTGNFNSLFGQKNSLLLRVGNFRAASSNLSSFSIDFAPIEAKSGEFPALIPVTRERARSLGTPEAFAHPAG